MVSDTGTPVWEYGKVDPEEKDVHTGGQRDQAQHTRKEVPVKNSLGSGMCFSELAVCMHTREFP